MRHKRNISRCLLGGLGSALILLSGCLNSQTSRDGLLTPFWPTSTKPLTAQGSVPSVGDTTTASITAARQTTIAGTSSSSPTTSTASRSVVRNKVTKPKSPSSAESSSADATQIASASPTSAAAQSTNSPATNSPATNIQAATAQSASSPSPAVQLVSAETPIPASETATPSSRGTNAATDLGTETLDPSSTSEGQPEASRLSDFVAPTRIAPLPAPSQSDSADDETSGSSGESPPDKVDGSATATSDSASPVGSSDTEASTNAAAATGQSPAGVESAETADARQLTADRLAANVTTRTVASPDGEPDPWRDHLEQSIQALEQQLAMGDLDERERVRLEGVLRLMFIAANRPDDAIASLERLPVQQRKFWKYGVAGFLELLSPEQQVPISRQAKMALRQLRSACHELATLAALEVRNLAFCRRVESFGRYTEFEPYEFFPEQEVILYTEVGNFVVEELSHGYESELIGSYQIFDEAGRHVGDYDLPVDKQVSRHIRTDYFLPYRVYLPRALAEGNYTMQVTMQDKKGKKFGQTEPVAFRIRHE